ncbi:peptide deformylase [Candidatus Woesebacteria bacterium]|nr:peptide deformylase [Candidatus Woesebacteria bacterium]QQG47410.1 MAG: peptide deformylase [Candidatus Woesebacteria bacterium]
MILKITDVKDPKLRLKSKPVIKFDKKIRQLISNMRETLIAQKDPEGVGLAAPQVGKSIRLFIIDYRKEKKVIINPEIISVSKEKKAPKTKNKDSILEGCLSLPHYYGPIKRSQKIKIKYQNLDGKLVSEEFTGFIAQIIQHEIDHLNGVLFVDRILEQKAPLYKFEGKDFEEVELI